VVKVDNKEEGYFYEWNAETFLNRFDMIQMDHEEMLNGNLPDYSQNK